VRTPPLLLALLCLASVAPGSAAQPDFAALSQDLVRAPRAHPFLVFTAEEKPALVQRLRADPHSADMLRKFELEGRRLLHAPALPTAPVRVKNSRYAGGESYEGFIRRNVDAAFTLAFLYQVSGDQRYADKAFAHAELVCATDTWVTDAHEFPVIYSRVWPHGAKDDQVVFSFDIYAARTARQMAYIYDWLYPALPKAQRDRLRGALLEKAVTRVRGSYDYHWWATAYHCNWSGICHAGLGLSALVLLDTDPQLTDVVARSGEGLWKMLDQMGPDGAWPEGRGYWGFALNESVVFMDAIRRASGGKINFFAHPSLAARPVDFALFGLTAAFGDSKGSPVGEVHMVNRLIQETGDGHAAWYARQFLHAGDSILDLLTPTPTVKPVKPADASRHFPTIDWAVLRKDFGPSFVTLATKAGPNDDPHHGHLDCGTFSLTWHNQTFVGEMARAAYDEHYFGAMRWDYAEANTSGHNVVTVNGEGQLMAKLKDQPWREGIGGKITRFQSEPAFAAVALDATRAYPGKELKGWQRRLVLDKDTNIVVVLDTVTCAIGAKIDVRFHPGVDFNVGPDRVTLRGGPDQSRPRNQKGKSPAKEPDPVPGRAEMIMQPLFNGRYQLVPGRHAVLPIRQEAVLTWEPYFSTVIQAPAETNVVATVFYPADPKEKASAFRLDSSSPVPAISFQLGEKTVTYRFAESGVTRTE
jgi:hypothetical protein